MTQKNLYVVTSNNGKILSVQKALNGLPFNVEILKPDTYGIIEPQLDDVALVVKSKAEQAWLEIKQSCLVEDSGFYIPALGNFPGAYTKQATDSLGLGGFVKLMQGVEKRECYFRGALYYMNAEGKGISFIEETHGTFANYIAPRHPEQWGDLWRIFIPEGWDKTLAEMTKEEHMQWRQMREAKSLSRWQRLAEHLKQEQ